MAKVTADGCVISTLTYAKVTGEGLRVIKVRTEGGLFFGTQCRYVCMYVFMSSMYVCIYVSMYVCMYVCSSM